MPQTPEQKAAYDKKRYAENKERLNQTSGFRGACRKVGIPVELANAKLLIQDNQCPGCGITKSQGNRRLYLDHDHSNGAFRGLLCSNCNIALGLVKDNPETLRALANYLEKGSKVIEVPYDIAKIVSTKLLKAKEENIRLKSELNDR